MRVHTSDSHKERSPSGQCAAISIPREGKLSQAKRERYLRKRKSLSLSFSLSSLSRYRSYRDCFRERLAKEDRDASTLTTTLLHGLSPSARESTSSIDRSRKTRPIDFTKRNALWFHRSNGGILSCRMSFSLFPLSPFYRRPLYLVMKGIMKGSRSLRPPFPSPRGIPSLFVSPLRSTLFVRPPGSPPVAGSVYINVWGQS